MGHKSKVRTTSGEPFLAAYSFLIRAAGAGGRREGSVEVSSWKVKGLPGWLSGTESAYNAGDMGDAGSIPGSGRSLGGGNGNPLKYSCWQNPMDRRGG